MSHVHFIGIGGVGMSALARILLARGERVSGSDLHPSRITEELAELGATIYIGHRAEQVKGADEVVVSAAIPGDNPELREARARGIPVLHRAELLARLLNSGLSVAVSGAHGKTTVTSMVTVALQAAGCRVQPVIGGTIRPPTTNGNGQVVAPAEAAAHAVLDVTDALSPNGYSGGYRREEWVVAEADESDASFLYYHPMVAVVTNIEPDHLENYGGSFARLVDAFRRFLSQVRPEGIGVVGVDSPVLRELVEGWPRPLIRYGLSEEGRPEWTADQIELGERGSRARVWHRGEVVGELRLSVPGRHNIVNALAALAVAEWAGARLEPVFAALEIFAGAHRRFELVGEVDGVRVVDDYAHHPSEIKATIAAARSLRPGRLWAVFQPHRFARTYYLLHEFPPAFADADEIVITEVYSPPPEKPLPNVSGERLAAEVERVLQRPVHYVATLPELVEFVLSRVRPGDLVLCMGAGDITQAAREIGRRLVEGARK
ncbi:MAG: UDP-N-acetylmuramate--L-alanine ligase [Limnochordales bacterium]|nr:UDP-N-acetylmuramate--L-alanine ligase [Limnochordales bacterium]